MNVCHAEMFGVTLNGWKRLRVSAIWGSSLSHKCISKVGARHMNFETMWLLYLWMLLLETFAILLLGGTNCMDYFPWLLPWILQSLIVENVLHWMHHPTGSELLPQFAVSFYHFTYWLVLHWLTINHAALNFKHNHKILIAIVGSIQETACLVCVHQFLCLVHFGEPSLLLTAWCRWAFLLWLVFSLTVVTSCIISAINLGCGPFLLAFHAPFYCFIRFWEVFAEVFSS